jgi:hypothetical protein
VLDKPLDDLPVGRHPLLLRHAGILAETVDEPRSDASHLCEESCR